MAPQLNSDFIFEPQPGEYVEALVAQGRIEDARKAQTAQFTEGFMRAAHYHTAVNDFEPAARQAGYEAGIEWLSTATDQEA